ncbi:MAG: peptide chain release factor N(5)-glutamine methyltransferase [Flavobacteriales bacterium]|nr:peptide chain release factor N(5)-glutamine methyltransferase [Flavobacteriales bacterium]MCB9335003.1 peptide chain release factor N(5)-glutamine methyltransferase [Flavobacteriales bacterium]
MPDNTIKAVKDYFKSELISFYDEAEIIAMYYVLMQHYFQLSKSQLVLSDKKRLSESDLLKIIYAVKDLKKNKPLAYILGEWEFFGLPFKVNEHTLIPRPETEELVQLILDENQGEINLLDIGAGTGCIPISLKKQMKNWKVSGLDISNEALDIAQYNAHLNDVEVTFFQYDILQNRNAHLDVKLDVIVSNPPYIPEADKDQMNTNVLNYEPHLALFVANNKPLLFYDVISEFAINNLNKGGKLYFEIHEKYGKEVVDILVQKGFENVKLMKDINEKDRIVKAVLN